MYTVMLHATDLEENHFKMCQQAVAIAKQFKAELHLLHVVEAPPSIVLAQGLGFAEIESPEPLLEDARAVMQVLGESLKIPKKHLYVELGSINKQILKKTTEIDCQMLIIGHHTFSKLSFCMGDNTRVIMDEARCDVLTLR